MNSKQEQTILTTSAVLLGLLLVNTSLAESGSSSSLSRPAALHAHAKPSGKHVTQSSKIVRVRLGDLSYSAAVGPEDAPVTIVSFIDYECAYCARAHNTLEEVIKTYGDKVRIVFKHNPLSFHPDAALAAQASLTAMDMDAEKFVSYHRLLMKNQKALGRVKLTEYAAEVGFDPEEFTSVLDSGAFADAVEADAALAKKVGVTATPFFFLNGRPLRGAKPFAAFANFIDQELGGSAGATRWVERVEGRKRTRANSPAAPEAQNKAAARKDLSVERLLFAKMQALELEMRKLRVKVAVLQKTVTDLRKRCQEPFSVLGSFPAHHRGSGKGS